MKTKLFWILLLVFFLGLLIATHGEPPEVPQAAALPERTFYFAATTLDNGVESDYSNEVMSTNPWPVLAWDGVTNATGYAIHRGQESGIYTNTWETGTTNTQFSVPRPMPRTNTVINITSHRATNLQYRTSRDGPWLLTGYTNRAWTNPAWGNFREWRGMGSRSYRPATVYISRRVE